MENSYVLSYDVGTGSVKTVIVDFKGNVVSVANAGYALLTPQAGWAEQDPAAYWDAVCSSTKQALKQVRIPASSIKGVAFGTQWKGIIPLDTQDNILHNNIIWLDSRAVKQADEINKKMNMNIFYGNDYWPKLMWVKEELPEIYQKTACFLEVNSYLKFKATGNKAVDLTNNFIFTTDKNLQVFFDQIMTAAELDPNKFPPLVLTTDKVGVISSKAAEEMGLLEGTPVFGGCGDIPAITIGSGCSEDDDAHIYLGSSGWMGTITKRGTTTDDFYLTFEKEKDIRLDGLKSAGMSFNWAIDQFYHAEKETKKEDIYEFVNREIKDIPAGSLNLIATPWIYGAFPPVPQTARSVFFNITNLHDRRHMVNAVLEGICYQMRWIIETYNKKIGKPIKSIRVVGGCAMSDHWMQMMADILQIQVEVPENPSHAGAIGTAYCAFIGLGMVNGFKEAKRKIRVGKTFLPRLDSVKTYDMLFEVFKKIAPTTEEMFNIINK
jgi:xylulokinase